MRASATAACILLVTAPPLAADPADDDIRAALKARNVPGLSVVKDGRISYASRWRRTPAASTVSSPAAWWCR